MMEEADAGEGHGNAVLVACGDDMVVANRTAGLRHIAYATLVGTFDVVTKGEEGIAAQTNVGILVEPLTLLLIAEGLRTFCEELLPLAIA